LVKRLWIVVALAFVSASGVEAQCAGRDIELREITGRVLDQDGDPMSHVVLEVREFGCTTLTDSTGHFTLMAPDRRIELQAMYIGYRFEADSVVELGPQRVDVTLTRLPQRIRDFSQFDVRPDSPEADSGIPGCYWIGRPGPWPRIIELRTDGSVPDIERFNGRVFLVSADEVGDQPPRGFWTASSDSSTVEVHVGYDQLSAVMFRLDLSRPVDWSAIPAVLQHLTDALVIPNTFDSFVTRVECAPGPSSS